jgi:enamine deaminase RidA (YjgF/YER057c/UK114 family)
VERRRISSGAELESRYGYSRAVAADRRVCVAGTAPIMPGDGDPPAEAYGQARRCLEIILHALAEVGAGPEHVVRTRMYLARAEDMPEIGRAHREVFGEIRPASTAVVVGLLDPRWRVEIEAEAVLPG